MIPDISPKNKLRVMSSGFRKQILINNFTEIFGDKMNWSDDIRNLFAYEWDMEQNNRRKLNVI